jgi:hypothetical protein
MFYSFLHDFFLHDPCFIRREFSEYMWRAVAMELKMLAKAREMTLVRLELPSNRLGFLLLTMLLSSRRFRRL